MTRSIGRDLQSGPCPRGRALGSVCCKVREQHVKCGVDGRNHQERLLNSLGWLMAICMQGVAECGSATSGSEPEVSRFPRWRHPPPCPPPGQHTVVQLGT